MPDAAAVAERSTTADQQAELVRQIVDGDGDALTVWFQQCKDSVYSFVFYRVGGDADLAADATQATFLAALEKLTDFDPQRGDMVNWLRYLSRNVVRDLLARHRRGVQLQAVWDGIDDQLSETLRGIDTLALPDAAVEREETQQLVGMTLANLPAHYREVLEARYIEGQSLQAIAAARDTTLDSIKSMNRRARAAFRDCFLAIAKLEMHDVLEQPNDHLLDENIARLLSTRPEQPQLPADAERQMLDALQAKQQSLYPRKRKTMDVATPATTTTRQQTYALAAVLLALAATVLIAFWANQDSIVDLPVDESMMQFKSVKAEKVVREKLANGTIVIARAGAQYTISGFRLLTLDKGDLYLIVAKGERPFYVRTKYGNVTALGTRFAVSADNKQTSAAVAQGRVELASDAGRIELRAGQQGTLTAGERPRRQPAPRLSYLVSWAREQLAQEELLVEKADAQSGLVAMDPWGQEVRLTLRKYDVDVYIEDGIARTTIDQTFFNHNPWNTEGTFYFPLPPDASVSRLAMYVAGHLNEGGMVERGYGQQVYNDIRYQWRDPALLEMMEGNVFKMRIFPLEGRQEKRVFLSYTQTLQELYGTLRYWFPMDHTHNVARQLSIRVHIKDGARHFDPQSSTHQLETFSDGNDLVLEYNSEDVNPDQDFLLNLLPAGDLLDSRVAVTKKDGHRFLFARINPQLTGTIQHQPRQWVVINDISASRTAIEAEAQRYIIHRLIQEADDDDSIAVIDLNTRATPRTDGFLSIQQARTTGFSLTNSGSTDRSVRLKSRLLGATNMEAGLQAAARLVERHGADNPHILYLGDGVATDGQTEIVPLVRRIPAGATFVGIGVGKKVEARFLQSAADATGGMYAVINPDEDIDWRVFDLLAALNTPRLTGLQVSLQSGDRGTLETIAYPSTRVLSDGETLQVVARYGEDLPSQLVLRGRLGDRPWEKTYELDQAKEDAEYIPRLWARRHIDELLKSGVEFKDEIVALSKQYYVVTPHTSLIVLENDEMYKEYKVERGRKDHWALYPRPEIEVVKEPVDRSRWDWWGGAWQGEDDKVKAKAKPKSIKEIVESVQFRINAPFYYWRPQRNGQGRYALYQLLDSEADPTRLLTYVFAVASGKPLPSMKQPAGDGSGGAITETPQPDPKPDPMPALVSGQSVAGELLLPMFGQVVNGKQMAISGLYELPEKAGEANVQLSSKLSTISRLFPGNSSDDLIVMTVPAFGGFDSDDADGSLGLAFRDSRKAQRMLWMQFRGKGSKYKRVAAPALANGLMASGTFGLLGNEIPEPVMRGYQKALNGRWARIERDVRSFNRRYGYWDDGGWSNGWNSLDLTRSGSARWYGGLEGLVSNESDRDGRFVNVFGEGAEDEDMPGEEMPSLSSLGYVGGPGSGRGRMPTITQLAAYGQTMKTLPGACAILAADYLVPRHAALREEGQQKQKELELTELALSGTEAAAARLEDSGAFWSWQGWSYQPQPWSFQPPTVQAHPHYNWSFDLTRYADGLYSTQFDVLIEVAGQFGLGAGNGKISDAARARIEQARAAIGAVRIRYGEAGSEIVAASGDRFAVRRRTDMYLNERMICDGQNVLHDYAELGLVARRKATELRLAALRQLAPHFVQPADSIARRFDVALEGTGDDSFTLRLSPLVQTDTSPKRKRGKASGSLPARGAGVEDGSVRHQDKDQYHILVRIGNDGLIRHKTLMVNDLLRLKLTYQYEDEKVSVHWFDKDDKQLAEHSFEAEPIDAATIAKESTFDVDLSEQVVIDMPLRRPSYYTQQLSELGEDDVDQKVRLKRHYALATIQELQWRRWGQTNPEAQKSLTEAIELLNKSGRKATLGDLTLLGSAGVHNIQQLVADKTGVPKSNPVYRYFHMRSAGWADASKLRDEHSDSLVGHLSSYYAATQQRENMDSFDAFLKEYVDSPLVLAAAYFRGNWGSTPEPWLRLFDQPRWRGMAILMSAGTMKKPEHRAQLAGAFKEWYDEITEAGYDMAIPQQLVHHLKQHDEGKLWREIIEGKFQRAKEQEQVAPLLGFAENSLSWGNPILAEQALELVGERLDKRDTLLARLALAQVYWAGGRPQDALKLYDEILTALDKQQVPASPALLAATARLAQQAGDAGRAIELEEQALAAEHAYLPEMINLQAFRQRYNWLWQQYQSRIQSAVSQNDDKAVTDWLSRAQATWQRWFEVDQENPQMIQQMANLLETAGRSEDAWLYLSTLIDQKPKDANSYYHVGQWYLGRNNPDKAQQYYATAYTWDTANPRWLFERAQVLDNMQRRDEARKLYGKVINGKWAPGLQGYVNQAKQALK